MEWSEYRYFDKATIGLDFEGMTADLEQAPDGSVVVLHGELSLQRFAFMFKESVMHVSGEPTRTPQARWSARGAQSS